MQDSPTGHLWMARALEPAFLVTSPRITMVVGLLWGRGDFIRRAHHVDSVALVFTETESQSGVHGLLGCSLSFHSI